MLTAQAVLATQTAQAALRLAETAEGEQFDENLVSPGVAGFLVVAVLALAVFALGMNLVRRLRRNRYRYEIREELEAEIAERDAAAAAGSELNRGEAGNAPETDDTAHPDTDRP